MLEAENFDVRCRVCLLDSLDVYYIDIYENVKSLETNLSTMLASCGGILVRKDDEFSNYLCQECCDELLIAARFREKCAQTELILQQRNAEMPTKELRAPAAQFANEDEDLTFEIVTEVMQPAAAQADTNGSLQENNNNMLYHYLPIHDEAFVVEETKAQHFWEQQVLASEEKRSHHEVVNDLDVVGTEAETCTVDEAADDCHGQSTDAEAIVLENAIFEEVTVSTEFTNSSKPTINEANPTTYVCDVCGHNYFQPHNLKLHLQESHQQIEIFACMYCKHCFTSEQNMMEHINACTLATNCIVLSTNENKKIKKSVSSLKCSECGKLCQSYFSLETHMRTHTNERPFDCEYCSKTFKTKYAANIHVKRHLDKPDYKCQICQKPFYETSNLNVHMRMHTGMRPYQCDFCGTSFGRKFLLDQHILIHTKQKPHGCETCGKCFSRKSDLKQHIRTHTGDMQHQCPVCLKRFIKRSNMVLHRRKHATLNGSAASMEIALNINE